MSNTIPYASRYFATAKERYRIKLKKDAGEKRPWSIDTHLSTWRFCQVHREDDRTTVWFRKNIREPLLSAPTLKQVEAAIIFRWFNRIETGEIIKDLILGQWSSKEAYRRLCNIGVVFTGAYIIIGHPGMTKLEGVLECIDDARPYLPIMVPKWGSSLQESWQDIKSIPFIGGFTGYEVISDLRWTPVLNQANDILTWCNAGPGCARGLGWITANDPTRFSCGPGDQRIMLKLMQELLEMSRSEEFWPQDWKVWEMREVEHWNCEHDKYMRAFNGQSLKRRYQS